MAAILYRETALLNGNTGLVRDLWVGNVPTTPGGIIPVTCFATVDGTFGAGGTIVLEFSDDGTNFTTFLTVTAALALRSLNPTVTHRFWRARVTAGDGTTSLNVSFLGAS